MLSYERASLTVGGWDTNADASFVNDCDIGNADVAG